jgi:hypothetical protein
MGVGSGNRRPKKCRPLFEHDPDSADQRSAGTRKPVRSGGVTARSPRGVDGRGVVVIWQGLRQWYLGYSSRAVVGRVETRGRTAAVEMRAPSPYIRVGRS